MYYIRAAILAFYNNCATIRFKCDRKHKIKDTQIIIFGRPTDTEHVHFLLAFIVVQLTRIANIACLGEGHGYERRI